MIDLGQIVVVRSQPEDRDEGVMAAPGELRGEFDRGQGFINRIERPRKQADLLAGDDGAGLILGEFFNVEPSVCSPQP